MLRLVFGLPIAILSAVYGPANATEASTHQFRQVHAAATSIGVPVHYVTGRTGECSNERLLGVYVFAERAVYLCEANSDSDARLFKTFKHELWHAAQHVCRNMASTLTDDQIRDALPHADRATLRELYPEHQHRAEAEARVVAQLPTPDFLRGFNNVCRHLQ